MSMDVHYIVYDRMHQHACVYSIISSCVTFHKAAEILTSTLNSRLNITYVFAVIKPQLAV